MSRYSKFLACIKCRRVFPRHDAYAKDSNRPQCPFCGSTEITDVFSNVVVILDPEKSRVAKELEKKERGVFALTVE